MKHLFKKLSAFLVMLMCVSATVQAQTEFTTMVVTKKNGEVTRFEAKNIAKVEWTNEKPATTGKAKATINGNEVDVNWVQLWAGGPKFAEYNVGVTDGKAESYGGYYYWGSNIDKDAEGNYNKGAGALTGDDDTATNLWGNNWRMPTQEELAALLTNCDAEWTNVNGVNGRKFTGKGDYADNSIFLPFAGDCSSGTVHFMSYSYYWSSTPYNYLSAYFLQFGSSENKMNFNFRSSGYSVRAVLAK